MKILQLSDGYGELPGKAPIETVVFNISKQLMKMGHSVTILEREHVLKVLTIEHVDGVRIIRLDRKRANGSDLHSLSNPLSTVRVVLDGISFAIKTLCCLDGREGKSFDVIHAHLPLSSILLILIRPRLRRKIVYTFHGNENRLKLGLNNSKAPLFLRFFSLDSFLMKRVGKVVVLNDRIRARIIDKGLIASENVHTIPNGVDDEAFSAPVRNHTENSTKVLFVGSIIRRKGVDYLIKAANILVNLHDRRIQFVLVGGGRSEADFLHEILDLISTYSLEKSVTILGRISTDELRRIYALSDIFVLPSLTDAFGLVVLEAMISGNPIVCTNTTGAAIAVRNGQNGFVVPPVDERALAEKIEYLAINRQERERMGRNSIKIASEEFSWRAIASKYSEVYEALLNRRKLATYDGC